MKKPEFKTARCILCWDDRYLLVVHGGRRRMHSKWGFPGGHVERGEDGVDAVRRELREELSVRPDDFTLVGDYYYKRHHHRIYAARISEPIERFDRRELRKIAWFPFPSVQSLAEKNSLHAGYEADAIAAYIATGGA